MPVDDSRAVPTPPAALPADASVLAGAPAAEPAPADEPRPDVEALADRIAELAAHIQAATYELLILVREFDERGGWEGFTSCAHWLSWRIGLAPGAAREHVRVARALADLPRLSAAMRRGAVSYSKVRAVTRVATPENEQALLDVALAGTAAHVEQVVRTWRRVDRAAEAAEDSRRHESRMLHTWVDDDGMVVVRGRLTPEVGAVLGRALDAALDAGAGAAEPAAAVSGEPRVTAPSAAAGAGDPADGMAPTIAQRRADALGMVAECALVGGLDKGTAGDRYQVVVHVDADTLANGGEVGQDGLAAGGDDAAETRPGVSAAGAGGEHGEDGAAAAPPVAAAGAAASLPRESAPVDGADAGGRGEPAVGAGAKATAGRGSRTPAPYVPAGTYGRRAACPGRDGGQSALDEAGGIHVSAETARRLACDAATVTMRHGPVGEVLDVGRRRRTISPALRRALAARDRHCRFPGCRATRCDVHHVRHWAQGGATALDNLVLLCRRHHRAVHEEGFRVVLGPAGETRFVRPDGRPLPEAPHLPPVAGDPLAPVTARLNRAGIRIGPHTATPAWRGERLDVDWAVSLLWRPRGDAADRAAPPA